MTPAFLDRVADGVLDVAVALRLGLEAHEDAQRLRRRGRLVDAWLADEVRRTWFLSARCARAIARSVQVLDRARLPLPNVRRPEARIVDVGDWVFPDL